jgi:hypothetical protein
MFGAPKHKKGLMWIEAILTREDLAKMLDDICPLHIRIGKGGSLVVSEPHGVELMPEVGLRLTVTVEVEWPILGVAVPLTVRAVTLHVTPLILAQADGGEKLAFKLRLDQVDFSLLPAFLDKTVVDHINQELEAKHVELAWDFSRTLSHVFELPPELASVSGIELKVAWGKVRTMGDTLVLAISFHASTLPRAVGASESRTLVPVSRPSAKLPSTRLRRRTRTPAHAALFAGSVVCAGLGVWAFFHALRLR